MKILDLFKDTSIYNENYWVDVGVISEALNMSFCWSYSEEISKRIKKLWVKRWLCTDTPVGIAIYTFDEKPFAFSTQSCRKCKENFKFVSKEIAEEVRNFIFSLEDVKDIPYIDPEEEVPDVY